MIAEDTGQPVQDIEAERHTLAAMMRHASAIEAAAETLEEDSFYRPGHRVIFRTLVLMMAAGDHIDPITVTARLEEDGELRVAGGHIYVADLWGLFAPDVAPYAQRVRKCANRRAIVEIAARLMNEAGSGDVDEATMIGRSQLMLEQVLTSGAGSGRFDTMTADEVCDAEVNVEPLIPGLLNQGERVVVVGPEGGGKSILGLQAAFTLASGVHMFQHRVDIEPRRVLVVDLENPAHIVQRRFNTFRGIAQQHPGWEGKNLTMLQRQGGLNLTGPRDAYGLAQLIKSSRAELVVAGPIYKMMAGIETDLAAHARLSEFWGNMCEDYGITLWLEAHAPYGSGRGSREMRPEGSTIWAKWCEFGVSLNWAVKAHGGKKGGLDWTYFKGSREEGRAWPHWITRSRTPGRAWPWVANYDAADSGLPDDDGEFEVDSRYGA